MSKHAPGPWHVHARSTREVWAVRGPICLVCVRDSGIDGQPEEANNARLIAATPALAEALREVRDWGISVMGTLPEAAEDGLARLSHRIDAALKAAGIEE